MKFTKCEICGSTVLRAKGDRSLRDGALAVGDKGLGREFVWSIQIPESILYRAGKQDNRTIRRHGFCDNSVTYFETTKTLYPFPPVSRDTG